jgi:hypothetical protein
VEKFKLIMEIKNLSHSKDWFIARTEWEFKEIYISDFPETCLCGHFPIKEVCVLQNKINNNEITVGNCCVKKFIKPASERIFQSFKRIKKDSRKSFNREAIEHAFKNSRINQWEYIFYSDTLRKRNLSLKQLEKRKQINEKIIGQINNQ